MNASAAGRERKRILHTRLVAVTLLLSQLEEEDSAHSDEEETVESREKQQKDTQTESFEKHESFLMQQKPAVGNRWTRECAITDSPLIHRVAYSKCEGSQKNEVSVVRLKTVLVPSQRNSDHSDDEIWKLQEGISGCSSCDDSGNLTGSEVSQEYCSCKCDHKATLKITTV